MASSEDVPAVPAEGSQVPKELDGDDEAAPKESEESKEPDIDAVQKRLEDLLSKQNLLEDAFIQQHMNAQMYIPLVILVRHQSLRSLGDEEKVLEVCKAAAQRSEKVGVDDDGAMVRPLLKPRRNTLILHDLPEEFPEEDLKALFESSPESESFCSLKPDVNNTAFASFKTDEAAQNVALWLRSQTLQGEKIKCSMKSEHFVRSFFPASAGPSLQAASPYMMPQQAVPWGYNPPWVPVYSNWPSSSQSEEFPDPNMGWGDSTDNSQAFYQWDGKGDKKGKSSKGKGKGRMRGSLGGSFSQDSQSQMSQMESGSDFNSPMLGVTEAETDGLPEPGYTHEFRKYSRQYIIEVCNAMDDIVKPESYEKCDVALFRASPCKDWAPLPTPMATFAASFFDDKRGGESEGEGQGKGKGKSGKTDRKASWGPKNSRAESHDYEESDWQQGDASWRKGSKDDQKRRSHASSWNAGKSWQDGAWQNDGSYQQHWVKKDGKSESNAEEEVAEWDDSGNRKMSWAEKVKGIEATDRPQRWVAKAKPGDDKSKEKDTPDSSAAVASHSKTEEAAPSATPESAKQTDASTGSGAAPASPTWADKVRQGSMSK